MAQPGRAIMLLAAMLLAAMLLAVGGAAVLWPSLRPRFLAGPPTGLSDVHVARGAKLYAAECAGCHGTAAEGQTGWDKPGVDGLLPAPPHDATGHTWQHSDDQLRALILQGPAGGGAPPGYRSAMPAYAGRLSAGQVDDVIAWIKAQWPAGVRAYQAAQNPGGPGLASLPGDWRFPVTCKPGWNAGQ